ncbi:hypothetical protein ND972_13850 [Vibrio diabolicus]|uniref:hypothetical protein n=1 Tax=Vibrio diabolicus TaxID=50719 RepID=UPI002160C05F|nr:hypothetical protein [Vibrio diabolicus]MCS0397880.1 hypothetical protein [Vibrio diabolicus]
MKDEVVEKIKLKAHFVIGTNSYERDSNDPNMLSAIDDAKRFLESLPKKYQEPNRISAATTADPENIIHISWQNFSVGWHSVAIQFKGNENFTVGWSNSDRSSTTIEVSSLADLKYLDIPSKIENLKSIRPALPGEPKL